MAEKMYSVKELSDILKLHPKTVIRFIHEEKIIGRKIGRSWMVREEDLKTYVHGELADRGGEKETPSDLPLRDRISVSAVVEVNEQDSDEASRVSNSLIAMLNSRDHSQGEIRYDFFYYPEVRKAKYLLYGNPGALSKILNMFDSICKERI